MKKIIFIIYGIISLSSFSAQSTESEARDYFVKRNANFNQRYLNFYLYNSLKDVAYSWGEDKQEQLLKWSAGISYKWDNFVGFGDSIFKIKTSSFNIKGRSILKNSLLFGVSFPDIDSGFPFYFGASIGGGVFFNQIDSESVLSLDYQAYIGLRLINIYKSLGTFIEWGLDNHFLVLSTGQYDNMYLAVGLSFVF
ncbi:MAG: hypothetical protein HAW60_04465 [Bdellovibrionales bacterium]|nr:hypothetical protein [Bdellovibrionales bacterium]